MIFTNLGKGSYPIIFIQPLSILAETRHLGNPILFEQENKGFKLPIYQVDLFDKLTYNIRDLIWGFQLMF